MPAVTHTRRSLPSGDTVYAVLLAGQPICADTADKAGTIALARRTYNATRPPKQLETWDGDTATLTIEEVTP